MIDRSPARPGSAVAVAAALVGAVTLAVGGSAVGALLGLLGAGIVGIGLRRAARRLVAGGALALFAGVLVAGLAGASAPVLLVGAAAAALAWDAGERAITIGEQVGRAGATIRSGVGPLLATTAVVAFAGGVGYVAFRASTGGKPTAALIALLVAVLALAAAVGGSDPEKSDSAGRSQ